MSRYPDAEWVPWLYPEPATGRATYYKGQNRPEAVVLHIMQGYQRTARDWANRGMYPKSWHFSVGRDGSVMQHLDFEDGGYHAGITARQARTHPPRWALWKGPHTNINHYTIGIEHEGFFDEWPWPEAQMKASKRLCYWLSGELNIPVDPVHFPPHADIDTVNRVNDFATPAARKLHYDYLMERKGRIVDEEARAIAEAAVERNKLFNDYLVIQRDVQRAINAEHPALWQIHKLLKDRGFIKDPEYKGDYRGYA